MEFLVRGIAIGVAVAAPVGPIGVLCARRALEHGFLAGFAAGLGAAAADAVYATAAAFGLGALTQALAAASAPLHVGGAIAIVALGARAMLAARTPRDVRAAGGASARARGFAGTFALTLANPATIVSFAAVVAGAGFGTRAPAPTDAMLLIGGVFAGSALWWAVLAGVLATVRRAVTPRAAAMLDLASGALLAALGVVLLLRP